MKKRRLKSYVIPSIYVMTITVIFISIVFLGNSLAEEPVIPDKDYSVDSLLDNEVPVISETEESIVKPYSVESVTISKDYYSKEDDVEVQKNSLIYYQNTYLQNTGILYTNTEIFDVLSVLDGEIKNITNDEIMGVVVEIIHNNNLKSYYYSLSEVTVKVGDSVKAGDVIGKSGDNKIENKEGSSLLFEIYHLGKTLDPNTFYETDLKNYN